MNTEKKKNLSVILKKMYSKKGIVISIIWILLSLCAYVFVKPYSVNFAKRTIDFHEISEVALGEDKKIYINENEKRIIALNEDGSLCYLLDITKNDSQARISGIDVDEEGNLYGYVTRYSVGGTQVLDDSINMYAPDGSFIKQLYYQNYLQQENSERSVTRLYAHSGILQFASYEEYDTVFYSVSIASRRLKILARQKFTIPYLYQTISLADNEGYYYAKITGEVGFGIIGKSESPLYDYNFDIDGEEPFVNSISALEGKYYCLDEHDSSAWLLNNESGFSKAFKKGSLLEGMKIRNLSISSDLLCGNTKDMAWYMDYEGKLFTYTKATLSWKQNLYYLFLSIIYYFGRVSLFLGIFYFAIGIIYAFAAPRTSIFYKLLMILPLVFCIVVFLLFRIFQFYQTDYAKRDYERITRNVQIVADNLDGELLKDCKNMSFFSDKAYIELNDRLMEIFSGYTNSNLAVSAQILVAGKSGVFAFVDTSNQGRILSLHSKNISSDELLAVGQGSIVEGYYRVYAPICDAKGNIVAYLYASTPTEYENFIFWETIQSQSSLIIISLLVLAAILVSLAVLISRGAKRASNAIREISKGNLEIRIEKRGNDEIGDISDCINEMAENLQQSFAENEKLTREVRQTQIEVVATFAEITEAKSGQTGQHVKRVAEYTKLLARAAGYDEEEIERIGVASMMHDVGKLLIPAEILEKPGKLTDEEFEKMKKHTIYGEQLLHNASGQILAYARIIALEHHERYNGGGYPDNKKKEEINPLSRMVSIADVFDALVSRRSYKKAWDTEDAFDEIEKQKGEQFDPYFVELFLAHKEEILAIVNQLPDDLGEEK